MSDHTSIMIGCPWYGQPRAETAFCLDDTIIALANEGYDLHRAGIFDCPLVGHARAHLVAKFMASDASHLLMIDGDMTWRPDAVLRLLGHDEALVMAAGPDKRTGHFFVGLDNAPREQGAFGRARYDSSRGLLYVDRAGLCFALIRRDAVEHLMEAHPNLKADMPGRTSPEVAPWYYGFFEQPCIDGLWLSEDFRFCQLCRQSNLAVIVDPWIELGHIVTHELKGRLIDQMQFADGYTPEDPAEVAA